MTDQLSDNPGDSASDDDAAGAEQQSQTLAGIANAIDDILVEWTVHPSGEIVLGYLSNMELISQHIGTANLGADEGRELVAKLWRAESDLPLAEFREALMTPGNQSLEICMDRPGGTGIVWWWLRANSTANDDGSITVRAIGSEITSIKQVQEDLRVATFNVRTLVDNVMFGVFLEDANRRVTYINDAMCAVLGVERNCDSFLRADSAPLREQFFGQAENPDETRQLTDQLVARGKPRAGMHVKTVDGRSYEADYVPVRPDDGPAIGHVWIVRDITGQSQQADELVEAHAQALESARMKSEFLAMMSHEIRTPINGIIGMAELLNDGTLDPERARLADLAVDSSQSLLATMDDILEYSRAEAGRIERDDVAFSPRALAENTADLLGPAAQDKGLAIELKISSDLPDAVVQDATKLRQVLINLVGNAVRFTDNGAVTIALCNRHENMLRMEVRDTGPGIAAHDMDTLFEPFVQASGESATPKPGGSGLGLAISHRLVALMDGTIDVESTVGSGSMFTVLVPFAPAVEAPVELPPMERSALRRFFGRLAGESLESGSSTEVPQKTGRILVVDDNDTNSHLALLQLERLEWPADRAADGLEAVKKLREAQYELVLMDLGMPSMDGYEATAIIRTELGEVGKSVPIIAMTANVLDGERQRCLDAGMNDYLPKPVRLDALREMVARWASRDVSVMAIDHTVLADLEIDIGDAAVVAEAAQMFLDELPGRLKALREACSSNDAPRVVATSHALKSSSGYFGANQLRAYCSDMEEAARNMDSPSCKLHLGQITDEVTAVNDELSRYVNHVPQAQP